MYWHTLSADNGQITVGHYFPFKRVSCRPYKSIQKKLSYCHHTSRQLSETITFIYYSWSTVCIFNFHKMIIKPHCAFVNSFLKNKSAVNRIRTSETCISAADKSRNTNKVWLREKSRTSDSISTQRACNLYCNALYYFTACCFSQFS